METKDDIQAVVVQRLRAIFKPDAMRSRTAVKLAPTDVLLSSGAKCGSTWMQHILHGLRSGGSLDFEDINSVVPSLELAGLSGPKHTEGQSYSPPMFKVHGQYQDSPNEAKTIVLTRNPSDAALSFYHYFGDWIFEKEKMDLDSFIEIFYCREDLAFFPLYATQMRHLASWYPHRKDKNVLWLHYEDLKADLKQCIKLISEFTGLGVGDEALLGRVEAQASLEFMKEYSSKFNSSQMKLVLNKQAGLPERAGMDCHVNAETAKTMADLWQELLKPVTGFESYAEMRISINQELGHVF